MFLLVANITRQEMRFFATVFVKIHKKGAQKNNII